MRARFYPCDVCVLTAYAVMFSDAAGSTVSSTAGLCDSEALAILGFTFGTEPNAQTTIKKRARLMQWRDRNRRLTSVLKYQSLL